MIYTIVGAACGAFLAFIAFLIAAKSGVLNRVQDIELLISIWICTGLVTGSIAGLSANFDGRTVPKNI